MTLDTRTTRSTSLAASEQHLLHVEDLCVQFRDKQSLNTAVHSVSFSLDRGETLAIVGESGSGKSVSSLALLQLLPLEHCHIPHGKALFKGSDLLQCSEAEIRSVRGDRISMIFQEPMTSLNPLHSIEKQIAEVLYLHSRLDKRAARKRVLELLELVGIPDPASRLSAYPHQLSGGQKQRVMIAMALANEPDILIADEPTTALDVTVQKQVLELIKSLQAKLGMAVILISHDLNVVRHNADKVVVMQGGHVVEQGLCREIFAAPQHTYTQALIAAEPKGSPRAIAAQAQVLLEARQLSVEFITAKSFWGKTLKSLKAADNISFTLKQGETLGIVGESGSGKTTLGLALLKLIKHSAGEVYFKGTRIDQLDQQGFRPYRRALQVVFQDPYGSLSPRMSIAQIISEGLEVHNIGNAAEREQMIIEVLKEVELDPATRHRYPHEFSGGQRQRIAIARALVLKPELIILDEPTSALDRSVQVQVIELLKRLQAKYGLAYIFISHDLAVVKALSHKVMVMKRGEVLESKPCQTLFAQPKHPYTQQLLQAAYFYSGEEPEPKGSLSA